MKKLFFIFILFFVLAGSAPARADTLKYSTQKQITGAGCAGASSFSLKAYGTNYAKAQYFYSDNDVCELSAFLIRHGTVLACTKTIKAEIFSGIGWNTATTTKTTICTSNSVTPVTDATSTLAFTGCYLEPRQYYTIRLSMSSAGSCTTNNICYAGISALWNSDNYKRFVYNSGHNTGDVEDTYVNLYTSIISELWYDETTTCADECPATEECATSTQSVDFDNIKNISLVAGQTDKSDGSSEITYYYSPMLLYIFILSILLICFIVVNIFLKFFKK